MTTHDLRAIMHTRPAFLAEARRAAGLFQRQLAEHIGVPRHTVARWERGERMPTGLYLHALAQWITMQETEQ